MTREKSLVNRLAYSASQCSEKNTALKKRCDPLAMAHVCWPLATPPPRHCERVRSNSLSTPHCERPTYYSPASLRATAKQSRKNNAVKSRASIHGLPRGLQPLTMTGGIDLTKISLDCRCATRLAVTRGKYPPRKTWIARRFALQWRGE